MLSSSQNVRGCEPVLMAPKRANCADRYERAHTVTLIVQSNGVLPLRVHAAVFATDHHQRLSSVTLCEILA